MTITELQDALVRTYIIDRAAIDDSEEYDDGFTVAQIDELHKLLPCTAPPQRKPLTEKEAKAIAWVGPVYAPDGVVTRTPTAYRQELERTRMDAIRRTEAAHGIKEGA